MAALFVSNPTSQSTEIVFLQLRITVKLQMLIHQTFSPDVISRRTDKVFLSIGRFHQVKKKSAISNVFFNEIKSWRKTQ
jgi:hypothetical protein